MQDQFPAMKGMDGGRCFQQAPTAGWFDLPLNGNDDIGQRLGKAGSKCLDHRFLSPPDGKKPGAIETGTGCAFSFRSRPDGVKPGCGQTWNVDFDIDAYRSLRQGQQGLGAAMRKGKFRPAGKQRLAPWIERIADVFRPTAAFLRKDPAHCPMGGDKAGRIFFLHEAGSSFPLLRVKPDGSIQMGPCRFGKIDRPNTDERQTAQDRAFTREADCTASRFSGLRVQLRDWR